MSAVMANAQRELAFRVINSAVVPNKKIKPKRDNFVLLSAELADFISMFVALMKDRQET
jgi:uncharacterized protein involved in exopolysaccharide biosynthesis